MKIKFKRASALVFLFSSSVWIFLAGFSSSVSSMDFLSNLNTSEVQETQDGRDISSSSYRRINKLPNDATPTEYIRSVASSTHDNYDFEENDTVHVKNCTLAEELLQQMKSTKESEWIINKTTLELLHNDPEKLIQCSHPCDKVIFKLRGVQKFKRTILVLHELELIGDSFEATKTEVEYMNSVSFTCPDSGPFLIVNATTFTANGFIVENCKESSRNGSIVIKTGSSAVFENIKIRNNSNRAINVESHSDVALKNSYFYNNGELYLDGGVILVASNVSLDISNSHFFGNKARNGGVLFTNARSVIVVRGSSFSDNSAYFGGALCLESNNTLKAKSLTMSQNNATYGGAIYLESKNIAKIESSLMSQNNASFYGGAICLHSKNTLKIENSTMSQNNASDSGGAMFLFDDNTLKLERSTISQNNAFDYGGAICLYADNTLEVKNSTMLQNRARVGGAICLASNNILKVENSTMSQNNADYGGVIFLESNNTIKDKSSTMSQNNAKNGGAVCIYSDNTLEIINSIMSKNNADYGGAIYLESYNTLKAESLTMLQNDAKSGGVICLFSYNTLEIINSAMSENNAGYGGAIYLRSSNKLEVENSTMLKNNASHGGAIYLQSSNKLEVENSTMSKNNASDSGGAMFLFDDNIFEVEHSTMSQNNANYGGAIYLRSSNKLEVENSTMLKNNANYGGAIYLRSSNKLEVENSTMSKNNASHGGAMYLYSKNIMMVNGSTTSYNRAENGGGIAAIKNNSLTINECVCSNNYAKENGGAIHVDILNTWSMKDSKLSQNKALQKGGVLYFYVNNSITLVNSSFQDNTALYGAALYMELNVIASVSQSNFSNNSATRHGTIYIGVDCTVSLESSTVARNRATHGGCLYGYRSIVHVLRSTFVENLSRKLGGCFYLMSSRADFQYTKMSLNNALEDGGGIYGTSTVLHIRHSSLTLNNANKSGGGVAISFDSLFHCSNCTFGSNMAKRGGGCYIESNVRQNVIAQMATSKFKGNRASNYGGGLVVKVFGVKSNNCSNLNVPCSRVLLLNTSFSSNFAHRFGAALVITKLDGVLVSCNKTSDNYERDFVSLESLKHMVLNDEIKILRSIESCPSWHGNELSLGTPRHVIGTFGETLNVSIDSINGDQLFGDIESGFVVLDVLSGRVLPNIILTSLDAFRIRLAPTLRDKDAVILDSNGSFQHPFSLSFESGNCTIGGIIGFVHPGNYTIKFVPRDDDVLKAMNMTLVVRTCAINEEPTLSGAVCSKCNEATYNFNPFGKGKCAQCPRGANCTKRYIFPISGYWHKSPCHDKMKKCIVEEACTYTKRNRKLTNLTQNYTNCMFTSTSLHEYEETQCSEGYKGPLCGTCNESFGRTSNFQCSKCGSVTLSVLRLLLITICLFVTTIIAIKGTLPVASRCLARQNAMTPSLEDVITTPLEEGTSTQVEEMPQEESNVPQLTINAEQPISSNISSQLAHDVTIAHGNLVETWKILLNFLQVNSAAIAMDVKWTNKVRNLFEKLNLISSATLNAISRPIDCLVASLSIGARAIWRYLFSLFVPMVVVATLSIYWGYRLIVKQRSDVWYLWRRLLLTTITVIYITYFDITRQLVTVFNNVCIHDAKNPFLDSCKRYWIGDTSIECYKRTHVVLIAISLVFLIVVSIGFPIACSLALLRNKNEVTINNTRAHEVLGLLCGPFKQRYVYWECVTMIKKAVLSIIIAFSYSLGSQAQGLLISTVLVFFLTLHSVCYPFNREFNNLNYYEIGSLMTSCITYTLVEFFNIDTLTETERSLVSIALFILNGGFAFFMCVIIARNFTSFAKASLKSYRIIDIDDEITWIETIRIYSSSWWYGRLSSTQN